MKALTFGDLVRSVLPWPFHKELSVPDTGPCTDPENPSLSLGMICSLSIPIITICALHSADHHREPAGHHLPLGALFHHVFPAARL